MSRLAKGGMIDRNVSIPFTFDGQCYTGHPGDTLASALLANDVRLMGRSFKYHRPRGVMTAGSEEPNALMEIGSGPALTPNTRATMQEVYRGLQAHSQNRFPSLKTDFMAVNDLLSPLLGAGFYYKTFMWPKSFWDKVYEPVIRHAAGLGRLSGQPDTQDYAKAWAHCDVLVIGAGPAGLMAALTAARGGARVILAEEDFIFGGRLNAEVEDIDNRAATDWAGDVVAELSTLPNVTLMPRTTVTGAYDGGTYGALQRVAEHLADAEGAPRQVFWRIVARHTILASGAIERPMAFQNNDRPGIMMAGAVRAYVNRFAVAPGTRVAVFTNNDDGWRTVRDMQGAGISVTALIDTRSDVSPDVDCPVFTGATVQNTGGRLGIERLTLRRADGGHEQVNTDCLAVSGGWNPALHLTGHMGGKPEWRADIAAFVPRAGAIPNLVAVGAANGDFTTRAALAGGMAAAKAALRALGLKQVRPKLPAADDTPPAITPFWHVAGAKRAWLDFQNDVTVKDVALAHRENFRSVEHMKRYTTLGMATDQGKTANVGALAVMAELTGQSIPETGTTIFRPPYTPVQIGALGAGGRGRGFAPERQIPSAPFTAARKAAMVEVGLWQRPAWFARDGEHHWRQSAEREVRMVRETVGICDVSTLGKIDVQGPDAGAFLDRIYTGRMSALKVGRVRYGLMLREDGFVMDDGTVARLGPDHFLLTTTTGAAADVLSHLEFAAQGLWPDLDVQIASVTEQWAQIAIAGPKARAILDFCGDISNETLPFMACKTCAIDAIPARLFRISYSGELAYELAVPARYGDAMMQALVTRAEGIGGGLYGLEALNILRIEKGYLTHAEMDGRVTAADLGMAGMLADKDFIGRIASRRPALQDENREQLVGLRPVGAVKQILGGSLVFDVGAAPLRENMQGRVSSTCYSPTLEGTLAMAFVKGGRARSGQQVRAVDMLRQVDTLCEIVPLPFYDAEGGKLRG